MNAFPSSPFACSNTARIKRTAAKATAMMAIGPLVKSRVLKAANTTQATVTTSMAIPSFVPRAFTLSSIDFTPFFSFKKSKPWKVNTNSMVTPPSKVKGVNRVKKFPAYSMFASIGTPVMKLLTATPKRTEGSKEPTQNRMSQVFLQVALSCLLRKSIATPRIIKANKMANNAK